jgi:predicted glycosyltransferase
MRRIAFYSYDERGLGHVRRSIAIADAFSAAHRSSILLIAGAREAALFTLPEGTDTLALPAPGTDFNGARRGPASGLDRAGTLRMRARALRNALGAYHPDVLVVDRMPLGVDDELRESLAVLQAMGTRLVLGVRDILDAPDRTRADLARMGAHDVLRRNYDAVWVYGDREVFDPVAEYALPDDLAAMVRFTGYLDPRATESGAGPSFAARRRALRLPEGRVALCVVGGGEDGHRLADAFARAGLPAGCTGVVVAGPFMGDPQRAALHAAAERRDDVRVLDFVPDAGALVALADDVVAMGGYSTVCELLASRPRALVVPRAEPGEQGIRARRLAARGAFDVLDPEALTPAAVTAWLAAGAPPRTPAAPVDIDGLRRLPALLDELLAPARPGRDRRFDRVGERAVAARTGGVPA